MKKIAFVVQRYGNEVVGGSEFLCKQIAEHLSHNYQIEILTTCAIDYITWRNDYPEGNQIEQNVLIRRFKTEKERRLKPFQNLTLRIFNNPHTELDERYWFEEQGPYSPKLLEYIEMHKNCYDTFIFFTYRYYQSIFGLPLVYDKSILIPTAEDEDTMKLEILKNFFKLPKAFIFLTPEEQDMINKIYEINTKLQDIIGLGLDIPQDIDMHRFSKKFNINDDYLLYVGRIDPQKGCNRLFDYFSRYKKKYPTKTKLILIGKTTIEIPKNDDIIY
ncbi:glycosyltransferase family 1 protein, partial [Methanosalsum natronophilum]